MDDNLTEHENRNNAGRFPPEKSLDGNPKGLPGRVGACGIAECCCLQNSSYRSTNPYIGYAQQTTKDTKTQEKNGHRPGPG